jgi:hypothetical protein
MENWWGEISFELNEAKTWCIGQRRICVQRKSAEWLVWNEETEDESFEELVLEEAVATDSSL